MNGAALPELKEIGHITSPGSRIDWASYPKCISAGAPGDPRPTKPDYSDTAGPDQTFVAYVNPAEITSPTRPSGNGERRRHHQQPPELQADQAGRALAQLLHRRHRRERPRGGRRERDRPVPVGDRLQRRHPPAQLPPGRLRQRAAAALRAEERLDRLQALPAPTACRCARSSAPPSPTTRTTPRAWRPQDQSADLTHVRLVNAGDTLPRLCEEIYGDPRMYLEVAARTASTTSARSAGHAPRLPPLEK